MKENGNGGQIFRRCCSFMKNRERTEVDKIKVVTPEDISDFAIYRNRDYVTLLTCTPYGVNSHRLLVRGHRVRYKNHDRLNSVSRKLLNSWQLKVVFAVIALFISFLLIRYIARKRK